MEENDLDINELVQRYEQMRYMGKNIYFDADEFALLADYYNDFGDSSEADIIVDTGLSMHPGSPQLMIVKAKVLVVTENYQEAYNYLEAMGDDSNNVDYLLIKMECLLNLDRFDEADEVVNGVLQGEFYGEELYTFVTESGYLYNDVDKYDKAIVLLESALKVDNNNEELLVDLAYAYEMLNNFDKAIELSNAILDLDPYSFDGWINLGKLYSMKLQYAKAIEAFDFALTINDADVNVLKMKALTLYLNDNAEEAVRIFKECLDDSPEDESLYDSLLEGYEVMERYDEMLEVIAQKEERFGTEGIMLLRAHIYLNQERYDEAQEVFKNIPEEEKGTIDFYTLEGELAIHRNDYETAEMAYTLAMIDEPDDEIIIDKLANISLEQGNHEKTAEYLEKLIFLNPDFPTAKARLAYIRFEIGAKEPFDEIMKQFTDDELRSLLSLLTNNENADYTTFDREKLLVRLNEARETRVLFKNIKY